MRYWAALCLALLLPLSGCKKVDSDRLETSLDFPQPDRPVSLLGSNEFSTETERDNRGEARAVMDLAEIDAGMVVADLGAGNGYYTVRLAERVGREGRVLAQDIDQDAIKRLGERVLRERFDNVSIKLGAPDDPRLPSDSFDRVFMVHMYHEVEEPYAFLWRLWPALRADGKVIVVDIDRPTDQHGIDPLLLSCELQQVGYELDKFKNAPELAGYYAQFTRADKRPAPGEISTCRGSVLKNGGSD
jgi:ubiquinone/menaquinone biosynthesis C-methylase UbiE